MQLTGKPAIRAGTDLATTARVMLLRDAYEADIYGEDELLGSVTKDQVLGELASLGGQADVALLIEAAFDEAGDAKTEPLPPLRDYRARDIMSSPAVACRDNAPFHRVAELLVDREISGVPVVDEDGRVVGVISERDLAAALGGPLLRLAMRGPLHSGAFLREPRTPSLARDIMSSPPVVAQLDTPMHTVADMMGRKNVNRIPILHGRHLVGIVTRGDILAAVSGSRERADELEQSPIVLEAGS
jgi:CBS domain-containing protein